MDERTGLEAARAAMTAEPENDASRLRFYMLLADSMLHILLDGEPGPDGNAEAAVFDLDDGRFILAFSSEDGLSSFSEGGTYHATMSGRQAMRLFKGQGLGLGLDLDSEEVAVLLPAEALDWLAETLDRAPLTEAGRPDRISPPRAATDGLLQMLDAKFSAAGSLAETAWLVSADYAEEGRLLLAFVDAHPDAHQALAQAAGEALIFSDSEGPAMDVLFVDNDQHITRQLAEVGLRFDLPKPPEPQSPRPAPGSDPENPPKLR